MARPTRHAGPTQIPSPSRTFFASTKTFMGQAVIQSERKATLLIDVLRTQVAARKFWLHDFVVMPDHLHLLITVGGTLSIERALQFIKGGFSYQLRKEQGYPQEVWQRGFSEVRVRDREAFERCRRYIAQNPVKAGLARTPEEYPYCFAHLAKREKEQGLKPANGVPKSGMAKAMP
jgi:putative transposase